MSILGYIFMVFLCLFLGRLILGFMWFLLLVVAALIYMPAIGGYKLVQLAFPGRFRK